MENNIPKEGRGFLAKTILISILIVVYSGTRHRKTFITKVDQELQPYYEEWQQDMKDYGVVHRDIFLSEIIVADTIINSSEPVDIHAIAGLSDAFKRRVVVQRDILNRGEYSTRMVLYHELGHYTLKLDHRDGLYIMNPYILPEDTIKKYWDRMVKEYVKHIKDTPFNEN